LSQAQQLYDNISKHLLLLSTALSDLSESQFVQPINVLSNATIGEHVRHIIEMYYCVINNYELGVINYEKRERNLNLQTNIGAAQGALLNLLHDIEGADRKMILQTPANDGKFLDIETNYYRELLYNLEHTVHHMALIRIGISALQPSYLVNENFGVADSTVAYRKSFG
jgi:hypothetical protein